MHLPSPKILHYSILQKRTTDEKVVGRENEKLTMVLRRADGI
jgi:hypothetical protein